MSTRRRTSGWASRWGCPLQDVGQAIHAHPDAKAILVNNPTYYGICSDLRQITRLAHESGLLVLVDEAHGTHFYFGKDMPVSAMAAGADMAAVSMHKSGGSLTQSSLLLCGPNVNPNYVRKIINLTQTTSGSYLLLVQPGHFAQEPGPARQEIFEKVKRFSNYAREEINAIGDYYAYSRELINGDSVFDFDTTKLSVNTLDLGLAGIEVYDLLRDEYDIQIEFGDLGNILAYISVGDKNKNIERLHQRAERDPAQPQEGKEEPAGKRVHQPGCGHVARRKPFTRTSSACPLRSAPGRICTEFVMSYPPGIPILAPGELVTDELIAYIRYAQEKGCTLTGPESMDVSRLNVLKGDMKWTICGTANCIRRPRGFPSR